MGENVNLEYMAKSLGKALIEAGAQVGADKVAKMEKYKDYEKLIQATGAMVGTAGATLVMENWDSNTGRDIILSGLGSFGKGEAINEIKNKFTKVLAVVAINVGIASAKGASASQLLLVAAMSIGESLAKNENEDENKNNKKTLSEAMEEVPILFIGALVGAVVATVIGKNMGMEGQALTAAVMQFSLSLVDQKEGKLSFSMENFNKGTNSLSLGMKNFIQGISSGLTKGFVNNVSRSYQKDTYKTGKNDEETKKLNELSDSEKTEMGIYQEIMGNSESFNKITIKSDESKTDKKTSSIAIKETQKSNESLTKTNESNLESKNIIGESEAKGANEFVLQAKDKDGNLSKNEIEKVLSSMGKVTEMTTDDINKEGWGFASKEIKYDKAYKITTENSAIIVFMYGDKITGEGMINGAGQKQLMTYDKVKYDENGKVSVMKGRIFREINGKLVKVGSFELARKGSKKYNKSMARAEKLMTGEALEKVKQDESVYTERDNQGNLMRVVYMDKNGKVLASENRGW